MTVTRRCENEGSPLQSRSANRVEIDDVSTVDCAFDEIGSVCLQRMSSWAHVGRAMSDLAVPACRRRRE